MTSSPAGHSHGHDLRPPDPRSRAGALAPRRPGARLPGPAGRGAGAARRARGPPRRARAGSAAVRRGAPPRGSRGRRAEALGVRIVGRDEPDYPPWLRRVYAPPPVLWVRGALVAGEGERAVAVVGSRAATGLGLAFARTLARDLASAGLTVVSGLARGIDTAAHRGALDGRGRTVAVLGSGLDRLYPRGERRPRRRDRPGRGRRERVPAGHRPVEAELPAPQPRDRRLGARRWSWSRRGRAAALSPPRGPRSTRGGR